MSLSSFYFSSQLSVFELLKWHTYIIVSSNGLKLQSLSRNMLHLRSKTHAASWILIISISNYSMLNVNNCNNFHNRGSCKFHKGNWLHTVEQRAWGILYKLQIHENLQFELSIKEIQFSLKHYLHKVYIQSNDDYLSIPLIFSDRNKIDFSVSLFALFLPCSGTKTFQWTAANIKSKLQL